MSDRPPVEDRLEPYVEAASLVLGLPIDPAWRESVLGYLKGMEAAAHLVQEFELPDEIDPGPVFAA